MRRLFTLSTLAAASAAGPALADATLSFTLPRQSVAEYHKPYVAVWLERADQSAVATAAVWYDTEREQSGRRFLKEMSQWWRKIGRGMTLPADGVSGATRAPGPQSIKLDSTVARLPPGDYAVVVEAVREVGGRDVVRLPVTLPLKPGVVAQAPGGKEISRLRLTVR